MGWQKRYFVVRNEGKFLMYFKKPPEIANEKP